MENIKVEYLPLNKLRPYDKNTRKHADYDVSQIMVSIEKYGFLDPIAVWSDKNIIVEGHGRLAAAKKLKLKEVPVIRLDHLTDEQRREYGIIHNKSAELSEWDFDLLAEEIPELDFDGFDIDWEFPEEIEEKPAKEPNDIDYHESISVVIDCDNDEQAEDIFTKLTSEGYTCRISTL